MSVSATSSKKFEQVTRKMKNEEMIQSDTDPWIKHLNALWDIHFEQREPPTEDRAIQINLGDEANPKPIFIS